MSILSNNFAAALKNARGDRSQAEFSRLLGLKHQQTYQAYEAGRVPDGETLYQIATKLGITFDELLLGTKWAPDDKQMMIVIGKFVQEANWPQLLSVTMRILDDKRLSPSNQEMWMRLVLQWALAKMPTKAEAAELAAIVPESLRKDFETKAKLKPN